jgi:phosphoglycerate dehydrogenase-like enzyme
LRFIPVEYDLTLMTAKDSDTDIVVLRQKIHGLSATAYAERLQERLAEQTVAAAQTPDAERRLLKQASVATGYSLPEEIPEIATNLELFACVFAGTGHLSLDEFEANKIAVTNASGVHGPNVAEYVLGGILSFARGFHQANRRAQFNEWRSYQTQELTGSTVTIIGLGAIGTSVAEHLQSFDVHRIGVRHSPQKGGPVEDVVELGNTEAVHKAVSHAEYVVLACPLTELTRGLVNANLFRSMPPETVIINVARGPVINTDDLVTALQTNAIRGAMLDVTDPEPLPPDHVLWNFGNVLITPHNAGHTPKYWDRLADIVAENIARLEANESLRNQVV